MKKKDKPHPKRGITRYSEEVERTFFFYATIGMLIIYGFIRWFGN